MKFDEYQKLSRETAIYPELKLESNLGYLALGLCGEAGEVADKVKKLLRDKGGLTSPEDRQSFMYELGDILWYLSQFAYEIGVDLHEVAEKNLEKTHIRKTQGKIHGEGDYR